MSRFLIVLLAALVPQEPKAKETHEDKALGFAISRPRGGANWTIRTLQYGLAATVEHKDPHVYVGILLGVYHPTQVYDKKTDKPAALAEDLEKKAAEGWKSVKRTARKEAAAPTGERGVLLELAAVDEADAKVDLKYWIFNNRVNQEPTYLAVSTPAGKYKDYEKEIAQILKSVRYLKR